MGEDSQKQFPANSKQQARPTRHRQREVEAGRAQTGREKGQVLGTRKTYLARGQTLTSRGQAGDRT